MGIQRRRSSETGVWFELPDTVVKKWHNITPSEKALAPSRIKSMELRGTTDTGVEDSLATTGRQTAKHALGFP
jgi:hypothetical protein